MKNVRMLVNYSDTQYELKFYIFDFVVGIEMRKILNGIYRGDVISTKVFEKNDFVENKLHYFDCNNNFDELKNAVLC